MLRKICSSAARRTCGRTSAHEQTTSFECHSLNCPYFAVVFASWNDMTRCTFIHGNVKRRPFSRRFQTLKWPTGVLANKPDKCLVGHIDLFNNIVIDLCTKDNDA